MGTYFGDLGLYGFAWHLNICRKTTKNSQIGGKSLTQNEI